MMGDQESNKRKSMTSRKIVIKRVVSLPKDKKNEPYNPFTCLSEENSPEKLASADDDRPIYDPFEPTLSDEELETASGKFYNSEAPDTGEPKVAPEENVIAPKSVEKLENLSSNASGADEISSRELPAAVEEIKSKPLPPERTVDLSGNQGSVSLTVNINPIVKKKEADVIFVDSEGRDDSDSDIANKNEALMPKIPSPKPDISDMFMSDSEDIHEEMKKNEESLKERGLKRQIGGSHKLNVGDDPEKSSSKQSDTEIDKKSFDNKKKKEEGNTVAKLGKRQRSEDARSNDKSDDRYIKKRRKSSSTDDKHLKSLKSHHDKTKENSNTDDRRHTRFQKSPSSGEEQHRSHSKSGDRQRNYRSRSGPSSSEEHHRQSRDHLKYSRDQKSPTRETQAKNYREHRRVSRSNSRGKYHHHKNSESNRHLTTKFVDNNSDKDNRKHRYRREASYSERDTRHKDVRERVISNSSRKRDDQRSSRSDRSSKPKRSDHSPKKKHKRDSSDSSDYEKRKKRSNDINSRKKTNSLTKHRSSSHDRSDRHESSESRSRKNIELPEPSSAKKSSKHNTHSKKLKHKRNKRPSSRDGDNMEDDEKNKRKKHKGQKKKKKKKSSEKEDSMKRCSDDSSSPSVVEIISYQDKSEGEIISTDTEREILRNKSHRKKHKKSSDSLHELVDALLDNHFAESQKQIEPKEIKKTIVNDVLKANQSDSEIAPIVPAKTNADIPFLVFQTEEQVVCDSKENLVTPFSKSPQLQDDVAHQSSSPSPPKVIDVEEELVGTSPQQGQDNEKKDNGEDSHAIEKPAEFSLYSDVESDDSQAKTIDIDEEIVAVKNGQDSPNAEPPTIIDLTAPIQDEGDHWTSGPNSEDVIVIQSEETTTNEIPLEKLPEKSNGMTPVKLNNDSDDVKEEDSMNKSKANSEMSLDSDSPNSIKSPDSMVLSPEESPLQIVTGVSTNDKKDTPVKSDDSKTPVPLNPTQILHSIGLNPVQQSQAQSAILSIAELSKHLSLGKLSNYSIETATPEATLSAGDSIESSAVEMYNINKKRGHQKKLRFQEQVIEIAKQAIKPYYERRQISKKEYKDILKKAVNKIYTSEISREVNTVKIRRLIRRYIEKYQQKNSRKKEKKMLKRRSPPAPRYQPLSSGTTSQFPLPFSKRETKKPFTLPDLQLPPPPPPPKR